MGHLAPEEGAFSNWGGGWGAKDGSFGTWERMCYLFSSWDESFGTFEEAQWPTEKLDNPYSLADRQ